MWALLALLLALDTTACHAAAPAADTDTLMLHTDRRIYSAGQEVRLTLNNQLQQPVGVNLCASTLERREKNRWIVVPQPPGEACPMLLRILGPGETDEHGFRFDRALPAGEYRFRTEVENLRTGERRVHVSNSFRLAG